MDYLKFSEDDYNQAVKAFQKRDYRQASEKLWGAAAHIVKAVAAKRGWKHDGHAKLFKVIDKLVNETGDQELHDLFLIANSLHTNFYEGWLSPKAVKRGMQNINKFLTQMKQFLTQE